MYGVVLTPRPKTHGSRSTDVVGHHAHYTFYVIGVLMLVVMGIILCYPDTLHHPDNLCYVDRYVTPKHIVPE